jgi:hypothetical protein
MTPTPTERESKRFWCHECGAAVDTRVDESSGEVCCVQCSGNFVEEIEEVRVGRFLCPENLLVLRIVLVCRTTRRRISSSSRRRTHRRRRPLSHLPRPWRMTREQRSGTSSEALAHCRGIDVFKKNKESLVNVIMVLLFWWLCEQPDGASDTVSC